MQKALVPYAVVQVVRYSWLTAYIEVTNAAYSHFPVSGLGIRLLNSVIPVVFPAGN